MKKPILDKRQQVEGREGTYLNVEDFLNTVETASRVHAVLEALYSDPTLPMDTMLMEVARERGFLKEGDNELTELGKDVVARPRSMTESDVLSLDFSTGLSQEMLLGLAGQYSGSVLGVLLEREANKLKAYSALLIDVRNPLPDSCIYKTLEAIDCPKRREQVENAIAPWAHNINILHEAFACDTSNKVLIKHPSMSEGGGVTAKVILEHTLENLNDISGNEDIAEIVPIELDFLSDVEVDKVAEASSGMTEREVWFLVLRYVLFDHDHDILDHHPTYNSTGRQRDYSNIKDQLEDYQIQIEAVQRELNKAKRLGKQPVLSFAQKSNHIFANLTQAVSQTRSIRGKYKEDFERLLAQPAMCTVSPEVGKVKTGDVTCRELEFTSADLPVILTDILDMPEDEKENLKLQDFAKQILRISEFNLSGIQHVKHLFESLERRFHEEPTKENILEFVFQSAKDLTLTQLQHIFRACLMHRLEVVPPSCRELITQKFRLSSELIDRFETLVKNYAPQTIGDFPETKAYNLTNEGLFLGAELEIYGVDREVDMILDQFAAGKSAITLIDGTHYNEAAVPGQYTSLGERIDRAISYRIMGGKVPNKLKNFTVVEAASEEINNGPKSFLDMLFGSMDESDGISNPSKLRQTIIELLNYNPYTILTLDLTTEEVDSALVHNIVKILTDLGVQVLVHANTPIPGIDSSVALSTIVEDDLDHRVRGSIPALEAQLEVSIDDKLVGKILDGVNRFRTGDQDPLHLVLETIKDAAAIAKANERQDINGQMVSEALAFATGTTNPSAIAYLRKSLETLPDTLKKYIFGQDDVIDRLSESITAHLIGCGNPERPLSVLLPGPTGVGKTWVADMIEKHFGMPTLMINGAEYKEKHALSRLTGSPPGYVGAEEGVLTTFMRDNEKGIVFVDEIEKAHEEIRSALMNFIDEGKMANGDGHTYVRRQFVILAATNAGAEALTPDMTKKEVLDLIGIAFADEKGVPRPEIAARFEIMPMLGIEEQAFKDAITWNLSRIAHRGALMSLQLEITEVDSSAVDLVFSECRELCRKHAQAGKISFAEDEATYSDSYFNLREIMYSIDRLSGRSINAHVFDTLDAGVTLDQETRHMRIKAQDGKLILEDIESAEAVA